MPSPAPTATRSENLRGAAWLVADMSLNIWALGIVKAMGAEYPAVQLVFLRALVGLALLIPWMIRDRQAFTAIDRWGLHLLRVGLSTLTLSTSFFAISRVPFALFTAINFTRPILLMIFAALLLAERIGRLRWAAALLGLCGAVVAVGPSTVELNLGLAALCLTVVLGTLAVICTRKLKGTAPVVMMTFYTAGLAALTAPLALVNWQPVASTHWPYLLAVGVFAQLAQICFLKAHWLADAGVLGPVAYVSIILSGAAGYLFFAEVPDINMAAGAVIIVVAGVLIARKS
jgi:drug/metabolite transporter (DMT)-like permease